VIELWSNIENSIPLPVRNGRGVLEEDGLANGQVGLAGITFPRAINERVDVISTSGVQELEHGVTFRRGQTERTLDEASLRNLGTYN
jgi:hypothetical protein